MPYRLVAVCLLLCWLVAHAATAQQREPLRVFILAGQSNMEGKGKVETIDFLGEDAEHGHLLKLIKNDDGSWAERDDVWIRYSGRHGKLTAGYGSNPDQIGPELMFGTEMGEHFDGPVLIIKTCWGGRSLIEGFRPPSAGMPDQAYLDQQLENAQKLRPETTMGDIVAGYGVDYRNMLAEVRDTLENLKELFPEYDGRAAVLSGFVWFQGWNDMVNDQARAQYTDNMVHFIRDVRRDLGVPGPPFVIAGMGQGGLEANGKMLEMRAAQQAAAEREDTGGRVAYLSTAEYWDPTIAGVYKLWEGRNQGLWTEQAQERWKSLGSDRGYHYMGAGKIFCMIGHGMAQAMLPLLDEQNGQD